MVWCERMAKKKEYDTAVVVGGKDGPICVSAASASVVLEDLPEVRALAETITAEAERLAKSSPRPSVRVVRKKNAGGKAGRTESGAAKEGGKTAGGTKKFRMTRRTKQYVLTAAAILGALLIGVVIYELFTMNRIVSSVNFLDSAVNFDKVEVLVSQSEMEDFVSHTDETKNILLCGCDIDQNGISRTDSMIILTIDHTHRKIKMTSLMRDMYLQIPGHGKNKLNASFTYGGGNLLLRTIYANFGMKIDRYVCVDYGVFASVVDTLGGVDVEIEEMELEQFNKYVRGGSKNRISKAGTYHFNGQQALSYCRIRKVGTDTARTARQRKVLTEIMKKCRSLSPVEAQRILSVAAPYVTTNMPRDEMTSFMLEGLSSLSYDTMGLRIPMDGAWGDRKINGIWYVEINLNQNARFMNQFIYGDDETAGKLVDRQQKADEAKAERDRAAYERKNRK